MYMSNTTTINVTPKQKDILIKAASRFNLGWQTYLKMVGLEHAKHVNSLKDVGLSTLKKRPKLEMITDDN